MSDPMQTLKANRSVFNPVDASMMAQEGEISPDMSIREYFAKLGVDVEGPLSQLIDMAKDQMAKGDPLNKMKSIAGGPKPPPTGQPPMGQPPMGGMGQPPQAPPGRRPMGPGLGGLINR